MNKFAILLVLATPHVFAQTGDAFEASLFDPNNMTYVRENKRTLDPLRSPLPMDDYLKNLMDVDKRKEKVENRVLQLMYLDADRPCNQFQNPMMEKREWLDLVNNSTDMVIKNFSDSLDINPDLKLAFLRDVEVMKHDPDCISGPNLCRLKLRANLELYTAMMGPNYPHEDVVSPKKGMTIVGPEEQAKMRMVYGIYKDSMKEVFEGRAKGEKPDLATIFHKKSIEAFYMDKYGSVPADVEKDSRYKGAALYAKAYQGTLADVQNILVQKKNRYEEKIGALIEPRKGGEKYDANRPYCQSVDLPNVYDFFSPNNYMAVQIPIPPEKTQIIPCVEKISLREERKFDVNFNNGSAVIENEEAFVEKVKLFFEEIKAKGFKITGYQILASSSQHWGKASPEDARKNNLNLSTQRAASGRTVIDKLVGYTDLDHVPVEKLAIDEGVTEQKLQKININVLGPASIPAGIEGKLADNKDKLYEALKADFDSHGIFASKEEYFAWLETNKVTSLKDATFKPFQFFKVIVEAKKDGEGPCEGKVVNKTDKKDAKSTASDVKVE